MHKPTVFFVLTLVFTAALIGAGCGPNRATTRITTTTEDRSVTVVIDGRAKHHANGNGSIITFGWHKLIVEQKRVVLDGGAKSVGIPITARQVYVKVTNGVLTVAADGTSLLTTPI